MLMQEILDKAAGMLCLDDDEKQSAKLLDCANAVYHELTTEYVHLKDVAELEFEGGRLYYDQFPFTVRDVISVTAQGGKQRFKLYPQYVLVDGLYGKASVQYVYREGDKVASDSLTLPPQFSARAVAAGVAAEYCYRSGLIDEGVFYKNRYDQSLYNLTRTLKQARVPGRRFV